LYRPLLRQSLDYPSFVAAQIGTTERAQVAVLERLPASAITLG